MPIVIHGLERTRPYEFIIHLTDGSDPSVKVYAKTYEDAEDQAVLEAGRVCGQDVGHLVTEIEGV